VNDTLDRIEKLRKNARSLLADLQGLDNIARANGLNAIFKRSKDYHCNVNEIVSAAGALHGFLKRGRGAPRKDTGNRPLIEDFVAFFLHAVKLSGGRMGTRREDALTEVIELLRAQLPPKITAGAYPGMMRRLLKTANNWPISM
jgi:hypothetical protein